MTDILVCGAGYAGAAAIGSLEDELGDDDRLTWISREDYHLLLHEVHRCIRRPSARETVTIPVEEIKSDDTRFVQGEITGIDVEDRTVELEDGSAVGYDYLVVCLGSRTAFYGIDGLEDHALTLKSLGDALAIHEQLTAAVGDASQTDPAQVIVGGAGLTGIQAAGEIAELRAEGDFPMEVHLVEQSDQLFAGHDHEFQGAIHNHLDRHDVDIMTGTVIASVDETTVEFESRDPMDHDVLIWAGGITGQNALSDAGLPADHNRVYTGPTLETDDERVFALGDAALVDQDEETGPLSEETIWENIVNPEASSPAPPTAEAAWEAGEVLGENVARAIDGRERIDWTYTNKGTVVSIGERAVAHGVLGVPLNTFSGPGARVLKKAIGARWIGDVASWRRAARSWSDL